MNSRLVYSIGSIFYDKEKSEYYILCIVQSEPYGFIVNLVCLNDGYHYSNGFEIETNIEGKYVRSSDLLKFTERFFEKFHFISEDFKTAFLRSQFLSQAEMKG